MNTRQPRRRPLLRLTAFAAAFAAGVPSLAGEQAIRLPTWVEPGDPLAQPASLLEKLPQPPEPLAANDLGLLLEGKPRPFVRRRREPQSEPPSVDDTPAAAQTGVEDAPTSDSRAKAEAAAPALKEPQPFVPPNRRLVRQLESVAETAKSPHAFSRLIRRYLTARQRLAGEPELIARADRVGGWAYESRGREAAMRGEHTRAINDLRHALALDSGNRSARNALAVSLAETGERDEALRLLGQLLTEGQPSAAARRNRAAILLATGDTDAAVIDCDMALALLPAGHPDRGVTLRLRGVALHAVGRLRDAAVDLNEALRLNPTDADARVARGHVFAEGGFYDQAIRDYADAVHADPANSEAYRSLAWSLATCPEKRLRDAETAVEAAWRARRLGDGPSALTLDAAAAAHAAAGDYAEAIRLAQQALMIAGNQAPAGAAHRLQLYKAGKPYIDRR